MHNLILALLFKWKAIRPKRLSTADWTTAATTVIVSAGCVVQEESPKISNPQTNQCSGVACVLRFPCCISLYCDVLSTECVTIEPSQLDFKESESNLEWTITLRIIVNYTCHFWSFQNSNVTNSSDIKSLAVTPWQDICCIRPFWCFYCDLIPSKFTALVVKLTACWMWRDFIPHNAQTATRNATNTRLNILWYKNWSCSRNPNQFTFASSMNDHRHNINSSYVKCTPRILHGLQSNCATEVEKVR